MGEEVVSDDSKNNNQNCQHNPGCRTAEVYRESYPETFLCIGYFPFCYT